MSSPKAAAGAASPDIAASLAALLSPARAEASRENGAKSKGPKTSEGKARASRNALKHGLCAKHHVVVEGECPKTFAAFEAALVDDLAPQGALQGLLAGRIARAAWRLERAERIEAELFAHEMHGPFGDGDLGLALIRNCNGGRAFETLLRYRGAAQAELSRALRLLKALQAEVAQEAPPRRARTQLEAAAEQPPPATLPNKPEARANAGESCCAAGSPAPGPVGARLAPSPAVGAPPATPERQPDEPESPRNSRNSGRTTDRAHQRSGDLGPTAAWLKSEPCFPSQSGAPGRSTSLLAGTALASAGPAGPTAGAAGSRR